MYKMLLVCDKEDVRALYAGFAEWEKLGFERPTIATCASEGISQLNSRRFDAISCLLSINEGKRFFADLSKRPEMLGMETARDSLRLRKEISNARRTLSSRDAARQTKQVDDLTRAMQGEFFCNLLRGQAPEATQIDEKLRLLQMGHLDANRPVVTASFRLPQGDYFLSEVWKYGRERLENALKNIFESGNEEMAFVLLVINPHHMRLIGIPRVAMDLDEVYARMLEHLERCETCLSEHFELSLDIKRVVRYDSLYALSRENKLRMAQ